MDFTIIFANLVALYPFHVYISTKMGDINKQKLHIPTGLSLSLDMYEEIETRRGQIPRSRYIENILAESFVHDRLLSIALNESDEK